MWFVLWSFHRWKKYWFDPWKFLSRAKKEPLERAELRRSTWRTCAFLSYHLEFTLETIWWLEFIRVKAHEWKIISIRLEIHVSPHTAPTAHWNGSQNISASHEVKSNPSQSGLIETFELCNCHNKNTIYSPMSIAIGSDRRSILCRRFLIINLLKLYCSWSLRKLKYGLHTTLNHFFHACAIDDDVVCKYDWKAVIRIWNYFDDFNYTMIWIFQSFWLIFLFSFTLSHVAEGLKCFVCNSHENQDCLKKDPGSSYLITCDSKKGGVEFTLCRKIYQVIEFSVNGCEFLLQFDYVFHDLNALVSSLQCQPTPESFALADTSITTELMQINVINVQGTVDDKKSVPALKMAAMVLHRWRQLSVFS